MQPTGFGVAIGAMKTGNSDPLRVHALISAHCVHIFGKGLKIRYPPCHGPPKCTRDHRKLKSTTTRFSLDQRAQVPDSATLSKRSANSRMNSTRADSRRVGSGMAEARSCTELSGVCGMHAQLPTTSSTVARKMGRSWVAA
ncbi:hypothetical protein OWV82_023281 [Melia azedarach]|uniref:Uncharacterized protein n=1 Tax=Melia azedarach TaxID=155640 RepID=A0ACC1WWR3_MELAZ|nr:hypothetical protein OWV82_023281 [Melia azedarach]